MSLLAIARILRAHGVRGELRVRPYSQDSTALRSGSAVVLRGPDGAESRTGVLRSRPNKNELIVAFKNVPDRNAADLLRGFEVLIEQSQLPEAEAGSFYAYQLVGCRVIDGDTAQSVGTVTAVVDNPAHDLLQVQSENGEWLMPFVEDFVQDIDIDKRTITALRVAELMEFGVPNAN